MSRWHRTGRVPRAIARRLLAADDVCWICGRPGATTVDHIQPLSLGGSNVLDNLYPAHHRCNAARGVRPMTPPARIARPGPSSGAVTIDERELRRRRIARIFDVPEQLLPLPELLERPTIAEPEPAESAAEAPVRGPTEAYDERGLGLRS